MHYKDYFGDLLLLEARFERYISVYTGETPGLATEYQKDLVKKIVQQLKRDDIIQWFLRWSRFRRLINKTNNAMTPKEKTWFGKFNDLTSKPEFQEPMDVSGLRIRNWNSYEYLSAMEHFLSLPIPEIKNKRLSYEHPMKVLKDFTELETAWNENSGTGEEWLDVTDDKYIEKILSFSNDFAWFDLHIPSCRKEGGAMGHCGNTASYKKTDTILSLRKIQTHKNGRTYARPALTFILDVATGALGEMKGRANEKPQAKYHPFILALLKHKGKDGQYLIKKIKGGGYSPENNFDIDDLTDEQKKQLLALRPEFKSLRTLFFEEGMTENFKSAVRAAIDPSNEIYFDSTAIRIKAWNNWQDLESELRDHNKPKNLTHYLPYVSGDEHVEVYDTPKDLGEIRDLFSKIERDKRFDANAFKAYLSSNYNKEKLDEMEESGVINVLDDADDPMIDLLVRCVVQGMEFGTYNDIVDAVLSAFDGMTFGTGNYADVELSFYTKYVNPQKPYDSPIYQYWQVGDFCDAIEFGVTRFKNIFHDIDLIVTDGDVNVPYHGFSGWDESGAIECFFDTNDLF
jgi:hypothetical protein